MSWECEQQLQCPELKTTKAAKSHRLHPTRMSAPAEITPKKHIHDLPPEILIQIFEHYINLHGSYVFITTLLRKSGLMYQSPMLTLSHYYGDVLALASPHGTNDTLEEFHSACRCIWTDLEMVPFIST
ncbi:hypothetical protein WG66_013241 [Moniliophthora roreri]|nr:hypothetical protein WG66_013241 [Moniliophthora roreri]